MKVARLRHAGLIDVRDEPDPVAGDNETLVRVTAVGICGSDLHWFIHGGIGDDQVAAPLVLGHEIAGLALNGPLEGQRVAVDPAIPCLHCRPCREHNPNLCLNIRFAGHGSTDGGLRELMAWPTRRLHVLPDRLSDAEGALLEPMGVAIHALDLAHVHFRSTVAVVGCGPIGLLALQLAARAGASQVLAVDPREHRRAAAEKLGADAVAAPGNAIAVANELTDNDGVDVAVEFAGNDDAVALAINLVRPGGRVVLGGIPDDDRTSFSASAARRKGLTMLLVRRMKEVYPRAIVKSPGIEIAGLVSDRFSLTDAAAAFALAVERKGLKVLVEP
jgi:L-iditol 2-dehydrogenase